jgi:hypothetical protein
VWVGVGVGVGGWVCGWMCGVFVCEYVRVCGGVSLYVCMWV